MKAKSRILVVDDNVANIELLYEILGDSYVLASAHSGHEALQVACEFRPEMILLDIMMPGIDGYETCRRLKANPALVNAKIILVSAKAMTEERIKGYEAGADDYIVKPFNEDELLAKLVVFLRLKRVEEVDRIKTDLITLLNHETRTPLNGVIGPLHLLAEEGSMPDTERLELVDIAIRSAKRLAELLEKALLFSSLRSRGLTSRPRLNYLGETIREVLGEFAEQSEEKEIEFHASVCTGIAVETDSGLIKRAIAALIDNAIRHSPARGVIAINVTGTEELAMVQVSDAGPGVDPKQLPHIFDAFHSTDIAHHSHGHKLSLALAQQIALEHGGAIQVAPTPGGGATFTLRLPRAAAEAVNGGLDHPKAWDLVAPGERLR